MRKAPGKIPAWCLAFASWMIPACGQEDIEKATVVPPDPVAASREETTGGNRDGATRLQSARLRRVVLVASSDLHPPAASSLARLPSSATPWRDLHPPRDIQDSVVHQEGFLPDTSYQHHGTTVWAYWPDTNYGSDPNFGFGRNGNFGWPYLRFDLSATIPPGSQVVQSVLSMYLEDGWGAYQHGSSHKVLSAWDEYVLVYNNIPPDWNNQIYESTVYIAGLGWWDWDVTQMTTDWVSDPASNFGLSVIPTDSLYDGDWLVWCSDDYPSVSLRPRLTVDYLLPEHQASFVSQDSPPPALTVGQRAQVALRFRNDGADTWTDADGYRLGSQGPQDNTTWGFSRVPLPVAVNMGEQVEFDFEIVAPASPGQYPFQWQMVHEGVQWFGDTSPSVDVLVSRKPNGDSCADPSECDSGNCVDDVCCDSTCAGLCMHCALAGYLGNCRYVATGQDPDGECAGDPPCGSHCDGGGGCAFPPAGTGCAPCATCDGTGGCTQFEPADTDPGGTCGLCGVCPGDGPDCVAVAAGSDPLDECAAQPPGSCGLTGECDGQGACAWHPQGTVCAVERCENDVYDPADVCDGAGGCTDSGSLPCLPYTCLDATSCRTDCTEDAHCTGLSYCENNQCVAYLQRGEPCTSDAQCITTHCTDGVCCDVACDGICERCDGTVDPGACIPVADGEDPRDACPGTGLCGGVCNGQLGCRFTSATVKCAPCTTCNGAGFCSSLAPAGTDPFNDCMPCWTCSGTDESCRLVSLGEDPVGDCPETPAASCGTTGGCDGNGSCALWAQGTECLAATCEAGVLQPADSCDGLGTCLDNGLVDCEGYACLSDSACRADCQEDDHCIAGFHCASSSCIADLLDGDACARDGECASRYCVDGVCCDSPCGGTCERCDSAGLVGSCSFVVDGLDPDDDCPGEAPCGGTCDGAGGCRFPDATTSCAPCARCDGAGGCTVYVEAGLDPEDRCGLCRVCPGDGADCVFEPAGEDRLEECEAEPVESCGRNGSCDGSGGCQLWAVETPCGLQQCLGDTLTRAPTCDGLGNCVDQGSVSCAPYACDGIHCGSPEQLHHISVEDAAGGNGQPVGARTLSTDDTLTLYAVGRDAQGNYLDDVLVTWGVTGGIGHIAPGPSKSAVFDPTSPGSGQVLADHHRPDVLDGATGNLAVGPGVAAGQVGVSAQPPMIPADGTSASLVTAGPVTDADGNLVVNGTAFSVIVSAGSLLGDDDIPEVPGFQRYTREGMFSFQIGSETRPARARIRVTALPPGTAQGEGEVFFGNGMPVALAGEDQRVPAGRLVQLDGSESFDPFGRELSHDWIQIAGAPVELAGSSTATPSFTAPILTGEQALEFELVVRAAADVSDPDSVLVTVVGQDSDLPVAQIVLDPESGAAPLEVLLDGSESTAAEGATLVDYLWTFTDLHPSLSGVTAHREFSVPGGHGVQLWVGDSEGRFGVARAQVSVWDGDNLPPLLVARALPERGEAPLEVLFTAEATDPDGSISAIEWNLGAGFTLTGEQQIKTYPQAGTHRVQVRAIDDRGLASTAELLVFVSEGGQFPPTILSSPPATAVAGSTYIYVPVAAGSPTMSWSLGKQVGEEIRRKPEGMQIQAESGAIRWVPLDSQVGPVEVTLVVRNDAGSDFQDFTVEVAPDGSASDGCSCSSSGAPALPLGLLLLAVAWGVRGVRRAGLRARRAAGRRPAG